MMYIHCSYFTPIVISIHWPSPTYTKDPVQAQILIIDPDQILPNKLHPKVSQNLVSLIFV